MNLAILDEAQILIGFETVDKPEKWVHTKDRFPVPDGCDLAVGRYQLKQYMPGKYRFEAIRHDKDGAVENLQADINIIPVLARIVATLLASGASASDFDRDQLAAYLKTLDAQR